MNLKVVFLIYPGAVFLYFASKVFYKDIPFDDFINGKYKWQSIGIGLVFFIVLVLITGPK